MPLSLGADKRNLATLAFAFLGARRQLSEVANEILPPRMPPCDLLHSSRWLCFNGLRAATCPADTASLFATSRNPTADRH